MKELSATFLAVLIVLLLIAFGTEATKLLAMAVEGKLPASVVLQVLFLKIPAALEILLPLVALISVLLVFGRMYQDQEMVVLQSCGISSGYFKKLVAWFFIPLVIFTAWITLYVTPWSYQTERELIREAQEISPVAGLIPGKFNVLPNAAGVLYAKTIDAKGGMKGVWIQYGDEEIPWVLVAEKGRFIQQQNQIILRLESGWSYRGLGSDTDELQVQTFSRFESVLPALSIAAAKPSKFEAATSELWHSDHLQDQATLQWRLVTPVGLLVFGLLGLKLSKSNPREGRFAKLFVALVAYIVYNQLLVYGQDLMKEGAWPNWIGLWPIPALYLVWALWQKTIPMPEVSALQRKGLSFGGSSK
ncbi:LPS export ABC transporter permease LptF [Thiomicrorhabdus sp. HH1]|uniref:Lipopolysaccharide export system permease protein LptF n=2 Tax=Piscirickettsiaceae TaxID=135616 RepID=A0ABS0BTT0_9GAMM|nr:LPS export ABC transporter permease LptF [Thiomicrorhabdus heinhorstiae]